MNVLSHPSADNAESPGIEPVRIVVLVDEFPLRRGAYVSLLEAWSREHRLTLKGEGFDTYKGIAEQAALLILSGGHTSIAELRLRAELVDIDMQSVPFVVISDRDEAGQVTEAIALGARGYLPTTTSVELAKRALTFILEGGDFFPSSALTMPMDSGKAYRRKNLPV